MALFALPWYGINDVPGEPVVLCGTCAMGQKLVQNAGRAFWDRFELPLQQDSQPAANRRSDRSHDATDASAQEENDRDKVFKERKEKRERDQKAKDGGLLKMSDDLKGYDLYELLDVEGSASTEDIKKSYRKLALVHHPDKLVDPTEEQQKHFLMVQEAFEILSDAQKRRRYDSTCDFDDSIPTKFPDGKNTDFYETFRPVFNRNARWSEKSKVPKLGEESTPIEQVKKFYDFWHQFESWRDPLAQADEEDLHCLEQAECREEKRWMERENAKVAKRLKQMERDRIAELVRLAEKNDPRMIAHREQVRAQREQEKAQKAAAKEAERRRIEEEARAAEEAREAIRRVEEEKKEAERKLREEQRSILKAARQRLRALHKNAEPIVRRAVHASQLQEVCLRLDTDDLNDLAARLEIALAKGAPKCQTPGAHDIEQESTFNAAVELLHAEILKCGATPIEDLSVKDVNNSLCSTSTASPDSDCSDSQDDSKVVRKVVREPTPEEIEAERLCREAEEAAEEERRQKRAEEQRKKREQQKKEDEKRQAAQRKLETKERQAQSKAAAKEEKRIADEKRRLEEQRAQQERQREEQRAAALAAEKERERLQAEEARAGLFEQDRIARLCVLEDMEQDAGEFGSAIRKILLAETTNQSTIALQRALERIAMSLPSVVPIKAPKAPDPKAQGKKAAAEAKAYAEAKTIADAEEAKRRDLEEFSVDLGIACLAQQNGKDNTDVQKKFAESLAIAIRPPRDCPELSKESKARIKKQRVRVRGAILKILRQFESDNTRHAPSGDACKSDPVVAGSGESMTIDDGTMLTVLEEGPIFESPTSYTTLGTVSLGSTITAAGPTQDVDGYGMVPIRPKGTIELRIVKVAPQTSTTQAKMGNKGGTKVSKSKTKTADIDTVTAPKGDISIAPEFQKLHDIANLATGSAAAAEPELQEAFFGTFSVTTTTVSGESQSSPVVEDPISEVAAKTTTTSPPTAAATTTATTTTSKTAKKKQKKASA